jgi:hypothetical protein
LFGTPQTSIVNLSNWVLGDILYIEGGDHNLNLIAIGVKMHPKYQKLARPVGEITEMLMTS